MSSLRKTRDTACSTRRAAAIIPRMLNRSSRITTLALLFAALPIASRGAPEIYVLSNRPDLISGGDVLIEVALPPATPPASVALLANGSPAAAVAGLDPDGRYIARITGLALGSNTLTAQVAGVGDASAVVVNHPNGGPVFSGPQVQPWTCQAGALDAQCNQPPEYTLLYQSTDPTQGLQPYDPQSPPTDVANTTTDAGVTVPFIVRQERGFQDRDEYKILTLFAPGQPWAPWAPQPQWNRKVLVTHGGGCGGDYSPGGAPLEDYAGTIPANPAFPQSYIAALGLGFAVMSTALDNNGHNCNIAVQAESLMMAKERLVEQYGEIRFTIGTGCSGGSLVQQQVSNAYPGIYQGLLTTCAYPDTFSAGAQFADYHMLRTYFEDPSKWGLGVAWSPTQFADVEGHLSHANAVAADELLFKAATNPEGTCVSADQVYDSDTNPGGVRCGILDYLKNILGPRPPEVWSANETLVGHGFGGSFIDNVGIQYGLEALQQLKITPGQFVDLNAKIGGLDIDIQPSALRIHGDSPALTNAYRSGSINDGSHLDSVPIIDALGPDPGIAHDVVHTWWMRWRLDREHGNHDNHVIWGGPAPLIGDPNYTVQSLVAMDRWLSEIELDTSVTPLAQKIRYHKPGDIHDQCSDGAGTKVLDDLCPAPVIPVFGTPRTVAGDVDTADTMKCQLRPLDRNADYGPLGALTFTDAQWSQLQTAFPEGVCDYTKPPVGVRPTVTWLTYQDASGNAIYGGTPLPPAPIGVARGWASEAFTLPEPGGTALLGAGIALLALLARRRSVGR
jgi:Tannase-like family of unknown function (DUF6351)